MTDNLYGQLLDPVKAADPLKDPKAKNELIKSLYGLQGFAKPHIDSFNEFVEFRANEIVTSKLNRRVTVESDPNFWMEYTRVRIEKPTHTRVDEKLFDRNLYPHESRIMNMSYSGNIWYSLSLTQRRHQVFIRNLCRRKKKCENWENAHYVGQCKMPFRRIIGRIALQA